MGSVSLTLTFGQNIKICSFSIYHICRLLPIRKVHAIVGSSARVFFVLKDPSVGISTSFGGGSSMQLLACYYRRPPRQLDQCTC